MSGAAVWYFVKTFWKPLAILVAVSVAFTAGYQRAKGACNAANLKAENVELKRQIKTSKSILEKTAQDNKTLAGKITTLTTKVEDYETSVSKNPSCILSDDDAQRLLNIK